VAKSLLLVCPSCQRHVRTVDSACPFCKVGLPSSVRASLALRPPTQRLSRAALYAFSMGTLSLASACGGTIEGTGEAGTTAEAGGDARDEGVTEPEGGGSDQFLPPYGHVPMDASEPDVVTDTGEDAADAALDAPEDITTHPPYGAPPPEDAGH
jgi:hypothetical protein